MEKERIKAKTEHKYAIIKEFYSQDISVDVFCIVKGIKRSTFYLWLKQFEEEGYEGLVEQSKRPHVISESPEWVQNIIVELSQHTGMGSKNISQTMAPLFSISHSGVIRVLRRKGIKVTVEKKRWKAFRAPHKNHTWQMDFLGPFSTPVGEISILVVLDDYSRYARSKIVQNYGTTRDAILFLNELIHELGSPYRILTDNGAQFRKVLDKWCAKKDIKHNKSRVRHPQTMGKVESLNKTLGKHFKLDFTTIPEGQDKLNTLMEWYNHIHYHSTIESTPATAYGVQKDKVAVLKTMAEKLNLPTLKNRLNNCPISVFT